MSTYRIIFLTVLAILSGCGGGGGGAGSGGSGGGGGGGGGGSSTPPVSISYSSTQVTFNADAPWALTPQNQAVTATITGSAPTSTLYVIAVDNSPQLFSVQNLLVSGGNSGVATIVPVSPGSLGAGTYQGTITVYACLNDPTCKTGGIGGSPATISVQYVVKSNVTAQTVSPYVVPSGAAGTIILRGSGFSSPMSVSLGGTAATNVSVVSDSELHVDYPALVAGSYNLSVSGGTSSFAGTLVVVDPLNAPAAFLPFQSTTLTTIPISMEWDAQRQALLVAVEYGSANPNAPPTPPAILRYSFVNGSWSAPVSVQAPSTLTQIHLSHDGSRVLALGNDNVGNFRIDDLDPTTLASLVSTPIAGSGRNTGSFALTNDGNAIVILPPDGGTQPYVYGVTTHTVAPLSALGVYNSVIGTANGSVAALASDGPIYKASSGTLSTPNSILDAGFGGSGYVILGSADLNGDKIQSGVSVYDSQYNLIGQVDGYQVAAVIDRAGQRVYSLDPAGTLRTFNLTSPSAGSNGATFLEVGTAITLAGNPGTTSLPPAQMILTPDGKTAFIAGFSGIAVQPTPP